ncbi:MAG: acetolactate synthase [Verrucomicrobia bacterium RIFCSPHIGHO2_12_FULL_41_10]|nr:MAG: acetolactate synthase [Verrucomicrobia bacterium RIFCSPHIGHO2_12_FULL_41_10]HLB32915.1 thiamine pyrophosphate-binding protein [Chthoniobacterales bacterium]
MKLTDYIIDFLASKGVTHFFGMSGGAAVHLFDSVAKNALTDYVCVQHEQSAAMGADGYTRTTGKLGVAITTSGPGATNLLTGVCCSYYDSIPTLMLTGQVATHRLKGDRNIRQMGFQETDVISIYQTVTKYAYQIRDPKTIRYHLEKAYYHAFEGRPGPVLLDIPDDLQRSEVDPLTMDGFTPEVTSQQKNLSLSLEKIVTAIENSKRPILILGGGVKTPLIPQQEILKFVEKLGIPTLLTWAGLDLLPEDHPLRVGCFGVYGPRPGNFAVQNSDFILCIGSRLSQNLTGGLLNTFARKATIAMVDINSEEMNKFDGRGISITHRIECKAHDFIKKVSDQELSVVYNNESWLKKISSWKQRFPLPPSPSSIKNHPHVDAYEFVHRLSAIAPSNESIFIDTGGNLTWTCNGWQVKKGQQLHSAWNNTPMGYSLPAAIGASFTRRPVSTTCIIGDGGLMLCLGELATIIHHQLPIRIFLFNNHCHGIQKQTIETWLDSRYTGVDPASGLAFPDFTLLAKAFGFHTIIINDKNKMDQQLHEAYEIKEPVFVNVEINPDQKLYPVLKYGSSLEDQLPPLDKQIIEHEILF